ncbi:MAG: hypothetical protein ABIQ17_02330 [Candidatus Limnocylindrales bacterium]
MSQSSSSRNRTGIVLGVVIALAVPVVSLVVAYLWEAGILALEPNGAFVQALQSTALWEIGLGPIGLVIVGRAARFTRAEWFGWVVLGVPSLLVFWFVSVAFLGGLAGEPF